MRSFKNKSGTINLVVLFLCMVFTVQSCHQTTPVKPSAEVLKHYRQFTGFTDPGEYSYLYKNLPESTEEVCNLIKKQLIHPFEARQMKDILPEGCLMEDEVLPVVSQMLEKLIERDSGGLTMDRKPENRLVVGCYHHSLLLVSILRSQGIPVRMRAGFARYFEEQANVRFGHVICEVWDTDKEQWIMVDPDRNFVNVSSNQFKSSSHAWINFRNSQLPDVDYTSSIGEGAQAFLYILLLDQAFVLSDERNYWHSPAFLFTDDFSVDNLTADQLQVIDQIAELMQKPEYHLDKLRKLYDSHSFLHAYKRSLDTYYDELLRD